MTILLRAFLLKPVLKAVSVGKYTPRCPVISAFLSIHGTRSHVKVAVVWVMVVTWRSSGPEEAPTGGECTGH